MELAITASAANRRFAEVLHEVQEGATFVVTSRGRPVAKITPVHVLEQQGDAVDWLLDYVDTLPRRHAGAWRRDNLYE